MISTLKSRTRLLSANLETPERLIKLEEVRQLVGLGKTTIYQMIADERFPAPYRVTPGAVRWSEHEIRVWIADVKSP